jgi:hypothetical protein
MKIPEVNVLLLLVCAVDEDNVLFVEVVAVGQTQDLAVQDVHFL